MRMAEIGCSEDLPCSQAQIPTARFVGSCFCERPRARRTARRTTIGAWSRTSASQVAVSCSVTFCTWGRSIPRRLRCGAKPSRCSTTTRDIRGHFRCSLRIAARASRPIRQSSNFACRTCSYADRANGAPVGWPGSCGGSWNSTGSGPTGFARAAKARNGIRSCRCWSRTD